MVMLTSACDQDKSHIALYTMAVVYLVYVCCILRILDFAFLQQARNYWYARSNIGATLFEIFSNLFPGSLFICAVDMSASACISQRISVIALVCAYAATVKVAIGVWRDHVRDDGDVTKRDAVVSECDKLIKFLAASHGFVSSDNDTSDESRIFLWKPVPDAQPKEQQKMKRQPKERQWRVMLRICNSIAVAACGGASHSWQEEELSWHRSTNTTSYSDASPNMVVGHALDNVSDADSVGGSLLSSPTKISPPPPSVPSVSRLRSGSSGRSAAW